MDSFSSLRRALLENFLQTSTEEKSGYHFGEDIPDLTVKLDDEFKIRAKEKKEMQDLNCRLSVFIEKVSMLEKRNKALEIDLSNLQSKPSYFMEVYQKYKSQVESEFEETTKTNNKLIAENANLVSELKILRVKYDKEVEAHKKAQASLKEISENATKKWLNFETKIESQKKKISLLEEFNQIISEQNQTCKTEVSEEANLDLSVALDELRSHYERLCIKNIHANEELHKYKIKNLSEQIKVTSDQLTKVQKELHVKTTEIHSLTMEKKSLEKKCNFMVEQHNEEITSYKLKLSEKENEIKKHRIAYTELMKTNIKLDEEIQHYRKLLKGGEKKIGISTVKDEDKEHHIEEQETKIVYEEN